MVRRRRAQRAADRHVSAGAERGGAASVAAGRAGEAAADPGDYYQDT